MATELEERFDDADMAFIDGDVQCRLAAFVASIEISSALRQHFHYGRLIAESRMMNCSVSVFILHNEKRLI